MASQSKGLSLIHSAHVPWVGKDGVHALPYNCLRIQAGERPCHLDIASGCSKRRRCMECHTAFPGFGLEVMYIPCRSPLIRTSYKDTSAIRFSPKRWEVWSSLCSRREENEYWWILVKFTTFFIARLSCKFLIIWTLALNNCSWPLSPYLLPPAIPTSPLSSHTELLVVHRMCWAIARFVGADEFS